MYECLALGYKKCVAPRRARLSFTGDLHTLLHPHSVLACPSPSLSVACLSRSPCAWCNACCCPKGTTNVENLLDSEDIQYMLGALKTLKVGTSACLYFICVCRPCAPTQRLITSLSSSLSVGLSLYVYVYLGGTITHVKRVAVL